MKKIYFVLISIILIVLLTLYLLNSAKNRGNINKVAVVNGIVVSKEELTKNVDFIKNFYSYSKQDIKNYPNLEKDEMQHLIEDKLIESYAKKNSITVTNEDVEKLYAQKQKGITEKDLLDQVEKMYGMNKEDYFEVLRKDILRARVQNAVNIPLSKWLDQEKSRAKIDIIN